MKSCKKSPSVAPLAGALLALALQTAAPVAFAQRNAAPVTLNFVNAEIDGVARAMGTILDRQFVVDPRVKGQITLYSEQPMPPAAAYRSFLAALRGLGFAVVESGGLHKIVPEAEAKLQTDSVGVGSAVGSVPQRGDQIATQIFRLSHENANNLVTVLRPLISPNNTINVNPGNNSLVITDYTTNLRRLARIISALDLPGSTGVEIIPLQHALASEIAPLVQRLASDQPGATVPGAPAQAAAAAGAGQVLADVRSNALILRAANPQRLQILRSIVEKLDQPLQSGVRATGNIFVVPLRNADATRLAQTLRAAFSGEAQGTAGGGAGGGGGGGATTTPVRTTAGTGTSGAGTTGTGSGGGGLSTGPANFGTNLGGEGPATGGFIQADPSTNSLIITAPEPLYRQVRSVIDQLDSRRAQVYVESLIVEVNANKASELGVQWQGVLGNSGDSNIVGVGTNFGSGGNNILNLTQQAATGTLASLPGTGINVGLVHNFGGTYGLGILARALQNNGDVNILSTPNLITLDNEEAKIVVGQNVPFITGQYTNTGTGTTSPFQTIERRDVGLTLRIRPQIGEGGTLRMTIFQESSAVQDVATGTANAGPTTSKRSIESTVAVDDGQIIVLGGLIQDQYTTNRSKVPLLGDLPVLGGLFRSESRARNKTNLMVFLRPVVMRTAQDATTLTLDRYDFIRAQQQGVQPRQSPVMQLNDAPVLPAVHPIAPLQAAPLGLPALPGTPLQPSGPVPGQAPAQPQGPAAQPPAIPQPVPQQPAPSAVPLPPEAAPVQPQS
ncbi:type II secretion system secretin GspD [Caldimonas tepidiphila]|uniref:type II secretion system secretin GspD n=1 Tax=Caldimonas tepidiphila TaxID=2315841 RepID=UPI001F0C03DF|nr:type II secretion system secretin GspD [Caldimonas tepidiphila]